MHLAVAARPRASRPADVDAALYDDRSVVKQLAMRRTLFVFPRDLLPAAWGSASARVATSERKRIAKAIVGAGIAPDGEAWLDAAREATLARLATGPATTAELRAQVPELAGMIGGTSDKTLRPADSGRAVGAHPPRPRRRCRARAQRRPLAAQQARVDPRRRLARRRGRAARRGRGLRRARTPLAGHLRPRHRRRRPVVARLDQDRGHPGARRPRGGGGRPRRRHHRLAAARRPRRGRTGRAVGGAAPDPRPDRDGLEVARLLPRPRPCPLPLRHQRQRRHDGVVGRSLVGCWVQDDEGVVRLSLLEDVGPAGHDALHAEAAGSPPGWTAP